MKRSQNKMCNPLKILLNDQNVTEIPNIVDDNSISLMERLTGVLQCPLMPEKALSSICLTTRNPHRLRDRLGG